MNKQEASRIVNEHIGSPILNPNRGGNVSWANINIAKDVWWIDIPVKKFKENFHLILNNARKNYFYWISIDKNKVTSPYNYFRKLRDNYISIELSTRETNKFVDVKSGGTGVDFEKFKIERFEYLNPRNERITENNKKPIIPISRDNNDKPQGSQSVQALETEMSSLFTELHTVQLKIQTKLDQYSDNKTLKGNEVVGWLGEIYGKLLFNGKMVDDSFEHDIETTDGKFISIKTRRGWNSGWTQSSAIPKIDGNDCPTHLLFVHLEENYSIHGMWLFEWNYLKLNERFRKHIVRGNLRSYIFHFNESKDRESKIYP